MQSSTAIARENRAAAGLAELERRATDAAQLLKLLANENRLMILCRLVAQREMSVGSLAAAVGLSQSALSQHLARLREEGLVSTRRDGQTVYYHVGDPKARRLLTLLTNIYCP
jgi:ArsR family transcriptional regulator, virulence genes transcriptional regulator